jgi:hypothetical protein
MWVGGLSKQYAIADPFKLVLFDSPTRITIHPGLSVKAGKFAITSKFLKEPRPSKRKPPEIIRSPGSHRAT